MKITRKLIAPILFTILNINLYYAQTPSSGFKCTGGVYYTYEDFSNGKIENLGILETAIANRIGGKIKEISFMKPDPTMTIGPKRYSFKLKENKIWGFRTTDGSTYRIYEGKTLYNLLISGPFSLWVNEYATIGRDEKGEPNWVQMDSFNFFISRGSNGTIYKLTNKNAATIFGDDPKMLEELKGILKSNNFQNGCNNLLNLSISYNNNHKK